MAHEAQIPLRFADRFSEIGVLPGRETPTCPLPPEPIMRQERTVQASIFDLFAQHEIGCELKKASTWLDEHPTLLGLVAADLRRDGVQETGRHGLPAEAVLR